MALRNDLLEPVTGENPSGPSLRYERVYDQIKEARVEEDDGFPAGDWQRPAKKADFNLVIKLAGDALATRTKDLQLLAWLTEAHVKREGITLLPPCLSLFLAMQEQFWETLILRSRAVTAVFEPCRSSGWRIALVRCCIAHS